MNFVEFCQNRHQELSLASSLRKNLEIFDVVSDSQIKSFHDLMTFYRKFLKWIMYPKCLGEFLLVKLHLRRKPEPVLMDMVKKQKEAEEILKRDEALEKKLADDMLLNKDSSHVEPTGAISEKANAGILTPSIGMVPQA